MWGTFLLYVYRRQDAAAVGDALEENTRAWVGVALGDRRGLRLLEP
jgi:hypothetical protein